MFTETELRDALAHSAARADALVHDDDRTRQVGAAAGWRRIAMPLLTAAMVAGTIVGIVVATAPGRSSDQSAGPRATTPAELLDLMHIGNPVGPVFMGLNEAHGYQWVSASSQLTPSDGSPQIKLIPDGEPYDAASIPRDRPVEIDGHTGYYGYIPVDPGADTDENTPSIWAVAFRNDRGDWVLASLENSSPTRGDYADPKKRTKQDPTAIVAAYEDLDVRFAAGANRVAYRVGWLPAGYSVSGVSQSGLMGVNLDGEYERAGFTSVTAVDENDVNASVQIVRPDDTGIDKQLCNGLVRTDQVEVCVRGEARGPNTDSQQVAQRVLDGLTVLPASDDPRDFRTMSEAFEHIDHSSHASATDRVIIARVTDEGGHLRITWSGPTGDQYAVVSTEEGGQPRITAAHRARQARVSVVPGKPYCITVQATDGKHVVETKPYPVRGATCR